MKMLRTAGFTIVELLVVIVVIVILASITLVSYNSIQNRAKATALASDIDTIEKAFKLYGTFQNISEYPKDSEIGGVNNPTVQEIINYNADFRAYLKESPSPQYTWTYDNDKDSTATKCNNAWSAVNLGLSNVPDKVGQYLDKDIDDGNPNCGKLQKSGSTWTYKMSFDQKY